MKKPALVIGLATAMVVASLVATGVISLPDKAKEATPVSLFTLPKLSGEWHWDLPKGIPEPWLPPESSMSVAKFELGRHLFYDKRLSGNGTFACSSCHFQNLAFTDGKALPTGSTGEQTLRSAQSIVNSAYHPTITWANFSLSTLEQQALVPMLGENPVEMGINDANIPDILQRFKSDSNYQVMFNAAFPNQVDAFNLNNIIMALTTFERGVLSFNAKYDQVARGEAEYSEAEARGNKLFFSEKAQCSQCHSGFNFTEMTRHVQTSNTFKNVYRNTGLYNLNGKGDYPENNQGIIGVSNKAEDMGKFRVASLRNIAVTAPFMHDGSIATLEEVLDVYAAHGRNITAGASKGDGRANPYKDKRLNKIKLDQAERADIIAFLKTLTDETLLTNPRYADPFKVGK
jgi:cytochrome c peroxidase